MPRRSKTNRRKAIGNHVSGTNYKHKKPSQKITSRPTNNGEIESSHVPPKLYERVILREELKEGAFKRVEEGTGLMQFLSDNLKQTNHVCLLGQDGSGRSTILDGFIYDLIRKECDLFKKVKIIISLKCGNYKEKRKYSYNSFFGNIGEEINYYIGQTDEQSSSLDIVSFIQEDPSRGCFVLDDIDRMIPTHVNETLSLILSGEMYHGCTVVSSCHEDKFYSVFNEHDNIRKLYTSGLTEVGVREIAQTLLSAEIYTNTFLKMTPYTFELCQNPLTMYYTTDGMKCGNPSIPNGPAGIFLNAFHQVFEMISAIDLRKFAAACYNIKKNGNTTLKSSDLQHVGLTSSDVEEFHFDTIYFTKTIKTRQHSEIAFCHPIILDGFVALHLFTHGKLTSMDVYREIFDDKAFLGAWNILTGFITQEQNTKIVINRLSSDASGWRTLLENDQFYKNEYIKKCGRILVRRLLPMTTSIDDQLHGLHLLTAGFRVDGLREFSLTKCHFNRLSRADAIALASCIASCSTMEQLDLSKCYLSSDFITTLLLDVKNWKKIEFVKFNRTLWIRSVMETDVKSFKTLLTCVSAFLDISGWEITAKQINDINGFILDKSASSSLGAMVGDGEILTAQNNWEYTQDFPKSVRNRHDVMSARDSCEVTLLRIPQWRPKVTIKIKSLAPIREDYIPVTPAISVWVDSKSANGSMMDLTMYFYQPELHNSFCQISFTRRGKRWYKCRSRHKITKSGAIKICCKTNRTVRAFCHIRDIEHHEFKMTFTIWKKESQLTVTSHQSHYIFEKEVDSRMKQRGFSKVPSIFPHSMKIDETIRFTLSISSPACTSFDDSNELVTYFRLTRKFLERVSFFISEPFRLQHSNCKIGTECEVKISYNLSKSLVVNRQNFTSIHRGECTLKADKSHRNISEVKEQTDEIQNLQCWAYKEILDEILSNYGHQETFLESTEGLNLTRSFIREKIGCGDTIDRNQLRVIYDEWLKMQGQAGETEIRRLVNQHEKRMHDRCLHKLSLQLKNCVRPEDFESLMKRLNLQGDITEKLNKTLDISDINEIRRLVNNCVDDVDPIAKWDLILNIGEDGKDPKTKEDLLLKLDRCGNGSEKPDFKGSDSGEQKKKSTPSTKLQRHGQLSGLASLATAGIVSQTFQNSTVNQITQNINIHTTELHVTYHQPLDKGTDRKVKSAPSNIK